MTGITDKESLTLRLEGDVSLEDCAKVLSNLSALLAEIEMQITGKDEAEIEWRVTDLDLSDDETPGEETPGEEPC